MLLRCSGAGDLLLALLPLPVDLDHDEAEGREQEHAGRTRSRADAKYDRTLFRWRVPGEGGEHDDDEAQAKLLQPMHEPGPTLAACGADDIASPGEGGTIIINPTPTPTPSISGHLSRSTGHA